MAPPPCIPSCGNSHWSAYTKGKALPVRSVGVPKEGELFPAQPAWTGWGRYTEPSKTQNYGQIPPRCDTPHWQITLYSNVVPQQTEQFLNHSLSF